MARRTTVSKKSKTRVRTATLGKRLGRVPAKILTKKSTVRARKVGIRARKAA